jgi:hypothetical protein
MYIHCIPSNPTSGTSCIVSTTGVTAHHSHIVSEVVNIFGVSPLSDNTVIATFSSTFFVFISVTYAHLKLISDSSILPHSSIPSAEEQETNSHISTGKSGTELIIG